MHKRDVSRGSSGHKRVRRAVIMVDMSIEKFATIEFRRTETMKTIETLIDGMLFEQSKIDLIIDSRICISDPSETTYSKLYPDMGIASKLSAELNPDIKIKFNMIPEENRRVVPKVNYSGFYDTELDSILEEEDIDEVYLAGMNTDFEVFATALDAFYRGYEVFILEDAVTSANGVKGQRDGLVRCGAHFGKKCVAISSVLKTDPPR